MIRLSNQLQSFQQQKQQQLEEVFQRMQLSFREERLHQEDCAPPVLALDSAKQLVDGPYVLAESFLPLLKLVVMSMQNWLETKVNKEFTMNELRLMLFEVDLFFCEITRRIV